MTVTVSKTYRITWQDIEIDIRHTLSCSPAFEETYGFSMDRLEVIAITPDRAPLPITETGYRSIFVPNHDIEAFGGVEKYILTALDHEATQKEWIERKSAVDQFSLF